MAELIIHYRSLENAAQKLRDASVGLNDYADTVNTQVARKITDYSGTRTTYINDADGFARRKMQQLRAKAQAFNSYATNISTFAANARASDEKISNRVNELTGAFRLKYGIQNSAIEIGLAFIGTLLNQSTICRAVKDLFTAGTVILNHGLGEIAKWYKYEGGHFLVEGIGMALLAVALAVVAIITCTWVIAIIAAVILTVIAVANLVVATKNSIEAYNLMQGDNPDPAWARRTGNITTLSNELRRNTDSKALHNLALGLDIVQAVCGIIVATNGISNLCKSIKTIWTNWKSNQQAFKFYSDLAGKVDVSTKPNTATFWSGPGNQTLAANFAELNGKTTLEMTKGGKLFDTLRLFDQGSPLTGNQAAAVWKILSQRYAEQASGTTFAFVDGARSTSIFNTIELPALLKNINVTLLLFCIGRSMAYFIQIIISYKLAKGNQQCS